MDQYLLLQSNFEGFDVFLIFIACFFACLIAGWALKRIP